MPGLAFPGGSGIHAIPGDALVCLYSIPMALWLLPLPSSLAGTPCAILKETVLFPPLLLELARETTAVSATKRKLSLSVCAMQVTRRWAVCSQRWLPL